MINAYVVVKLLVGRSEEQKSLLAAQLLKDVMAILNCGEESVSVALEDIKAGDWAEKVYHAEITPNWKNLYKKPGYKPPK